MDSWDRFVLSLTLKEIFYKAKLYKIEYEGIKREVSAFAIVFANASQYGNDARIAPNAKEDNGFIDFVIIKKFSPLIISSLIE